MNLKQCLRSALDSSVNWIYQFGKGSLEARYVRRGNHYVSAYVSSHSGCRMGCKFCFLTQLGQTSFDHCGIAEYNQQLDSVLAHYKTQTQPAANRLNVNFMGRGEALANKIIIHSYDKVFASFKQKAEENNMTLKMNISTIMPHTVRHHKLQSVFKDQPAHVYYSLYSSSDKFRKQWLPNAMPYQLALDKLKEYQESSHIPVTLHWAFIKGQNDDVASVQALADLIRSYQFVGKFNIVRFNPPPGSLFEETSEDRIRELFNILQPAMDSQDSKIVSRVGSDVYASCGMFIKD